MVFGTKGSPDMEHSLSPRQGGSAYGYGNFQRGGEGRYLVIPPIDRFDQLQDIGTRNWSTELRLLRHSSMAQAAGHHRQQ